MTAYGVVHMQTFAIDIWGCGNLADFSSDIIVHFLTFPACFEIPIIFSNLNSDFSNLLDMRNIQEQDKKAFCYQKLFWPFTVWINCSSDLKNLEDLEDWSWEYWGSWGSIMRILRILRIDHENIEDLEDRSWDYWGSWDGTHNLFL